MVEDIIKAVNKQYIYVSKQPFFEMKENCKEKLLTCAAHSGGKFEAFFDCEVNENELIELLQLCESANTIFLGFTMDKKVSQVHVYNQPIYPGDTLFFEHDILILQDIPKDCFIECAGSIVVLGNVKGCIDLIYKDCTIMASSFTNARIQIFDSGFQNLTRFSCSLNYYKNNEIVKEDKTWEVALGLPQVKVG